MAFLDSDQDRRGEEKWDWTGKRKEPTNLQKKRMVARSMEIAVKTILSNHLYQMDGKVFRQQTGGHIGLEITGVLSRLVMLWWDKMFLHKLDKLGILMMIYKRYVDDGNMILDAVPVRARIVDGKLSILPEAIQEDYGIPADKRTAGLIRYIANTITPMIQMEEDFPSNHPTGRLTILDLKVWVENKRILHQFYKKKKWLLGNWFKLSQPFQHQRNDQFY